MSRIFCLIALDESADVGMKTGTPAREDHKTPFAFTGTLEHVVVDLAPGPYATSGETREAEDDGRAKRATIEE